MNATVNATTRVRFQKILHSIRHIFLFCDSYLSYQRLREVQLLLARYKKLTVVIYTQIFSSPYYEGDVAQW